MANVTANKKDQDKPGTTVGQVANTLKDTAQDVASSVAETAKTYGSAAVNKADSAAAAVGSGAHSLASTIREYTPHEGMVGSASNAVADAVDSAGRYLQNEGISGAAEDLTAFIRRNPIPAVLVGIGLGFLMARVMSSSSRG